jgi:hypothetical protein
MATTAEMFIAGMFLLVNTIFIGIYTLVGGPLFGTLFTYLSVNPPSGATGAISVASLQWVPGFFFTALLILEVVFVIRLGYVVVSKTDYQGETEW